MPDFNQELREWLHRQPDWLQQAAEAYLVSGSISEEYLQTCVSSLKTPQGQAVTTHRSFPGLGVPVQAKKELHLVDIGCVSGIENLGPCQPLAFGKGNLCVIYGNNGSGKSSYTRLLKKICGKPRAKELKANVFQQQPVSRSCSIQYQIDGVEKKIEWHPDDPPVAELSSVDLFDNDEAMAYLVGETSVTYTPPAIALLEALASLCDRAKACLQKEQDSMVCALPKLPAEYTMTEAGEIYNTLTPDITKEQLQSLTTWNDSDEKTLELLNERLKAQDPATLARIKREAKNQIDALISHINEIVSAFGEQELIALRDKRNNASTKRRNAIESAQVTSATLEGIGSDTWRALWQAARAYSQTVYPGRDFPVTENAVCVLCHQKLDTEAQQRLKDFESFVQGKLEAEASAAELQYQQALQQLPEVWTSDYIATRCQAAGLTDQALTRALAEWCVSAATTSSLMISGETTGQADAVHKPETILASLQTHADALEAEAKQYDQDATGFDRLKASNDKLNLEARRWTSQQSNAINSELERLRQVQKYEGWKRLTNSTGISMKATEMAEKTITEAFVNRFNNELKSLGANKIKVELVKTRTTKGKVLHKIRLRGTQTGQDLPEAVLSDGERRIIALAAFIADVEDKPYYAPFIFDDPISSLDQEYEWAVASRLATLAKERQVIILTHRLSLFGAMEEVANKLGNDWKDKNLEQRCIESFNGVSGHPAMQDALTVNTKKANEILINRLNEAKKAGETSGLSAYKALAQGICSDFRKLIERTIEDDLLNQVVRRHRRGIQTDNRLAILAHISADDCKYFDGLMTKYSCYEHSQSTESPVTIPDETELHRDLETLKSWREEYKKRPQAGHTHA